MNAEDLKKRTRVFALDVIRFLRKLPSVEEAFVIKKQVIRSATSVAANYRAACRAKTKSTFIYKLSIVEEEADETTFWLELIVDAELDNSPELKKLIKESNELTAIISAACRTARINEGKYNPANNPPPEYTL